MEILKTASQYLESYLIELIKKNSKLFNKIIACCSIPTIDVPTP